MKIISRKEALAAGLLYYFTGKPCPHGHIRERYVSVHACRGCSELILVAKRKSTAERQKDKKLSPRKISQRDGLSRYRTKRPCRKGHFAERHTINGRCVECLRELRALDRIKNPGAQTARMNDYRATNEERFRTYGRNRRAKRKGAGGVHTKEDIAAILKAQNNKCIYGHSLEGGMQVDHRKALAKGGTNDRRNLQILCSNCNLRKWSKDEIQFSRELGLLL